MPNKNRPLKDTKVEQRAQHETKIHKIEEPFLPQLTGT